MTVNYKPDELPKPLEDIASDTVAPPLVLDHYLSKQSILDRLTDRLGISIDPEDGKLTHFQMATLYRALADEESGRRPRTIKTCHPKHDLIVALGDIVGFPADDYQDELRKSQMIHLLLSTVTDEQFTFGLPSDPDHVAMRNLQDDHELDDARQVVA